MVISAKDTHSDGVRSADRAGVGFSILRCTRASVGSSHRPCATANNWPTFTLAPKALGASCLAFARRFAMRAVCAK